MAFPLLEHLWEVLTHPRDQFPGAEGRPRVKLIQVQVVKLSATQSIVKVAEKLLDLPQLNREVVVYLRVESNFGLEHFEEEGEVFQVDVWGPLGYASARPSTVRACTTLIFDNAVGLEALTGALSRGGKVEVVSLLLVSEEVWCFKLAHRVILDKLAVKVESFEILELLSHFITNKL